MYFDSTNLQGHTYDPPLPTVACYAYVGLLKLDHPQAVDFADFPKDDALEILLCNTKDIATAAQQANIAAYKVALIAVGTTNAIINGEVPGLFQTQEATITDIRNLDFPPCAQHLRWLYIQEALAYHEQLRYNELQDAATVVAYQRLAKAYDAAIKSETSYLDQLKFGLPPKPHPAVPTPTPIPPYLR